MEFLRPLLRRLARLQHAYPLLILSIILVLTLFVGYGVSMIKFQSDMSKEMPQQLPIYQLNNRISDTFAGQDTIFLIFMLDDELTSKPLYNDIRAPAIMEYITTLHNELLLKASIKNVISVGPAIDSLGAHPSKEAVDTLLSSPSFSGLVNDRYTMSIMLIKADVGTGQEKVKALTRLVEDELAAVPPPSGVKVQITGTPSVMNTMLDLLKSDSVFTILLASGIIFLLLLVTLVSLKKSLIVFSPLMFALTWTLGTMGWMGLKISVVTAGLGAMILGLGVEYGVFMLTRYYEERSGGKRQLAAIETALPAVGSAILGSGLTTIVGFLALSLSILPMLQHLGQSLALGIAFSLFATLFAQPVIILLEERFEFWHYARDVDKVKEHKKIMRERPL